MSVQTDTLHVIQTEHPDYPGLARAFWKALAHIDGCVNAPGPGTVGEVRGDRLQIQWWVDPSAASFAAQVVDGELCSMWEVFLVPVAEGRAVAGRRVCLGTDAARVAFDALWLQVFGDLVGDKVGVLRHPSFGEVVSAGASAAGLSAVQDDRALIEHLQADVSYWSQLARALDKGRKRGGEALPYVGPRKLVDEPVAMQVPPQKWLLRDIDRWAAENSERIVILPKAISATKRSSYESPESLYESLELLATHYTEVKRGRLDWNGLKEQMALVGVDIRPVGVPSAGGTHIESYYARWRGQRRLLDQHLVKGSSRDPRFCLRIYFTYDTTLGIVVVGSMPEHLHISTT